MGQWSFLEFRRVRGQKITSGVREIFNENGLRASGTANSPYYLFQFPSLYYNSSLSLSLGYEYREIKENSRTVLGHTNFLGQKREKIYF